MIRLSSERGFALPVTIFLVTLLTIMLASGFARVRADRVVAAGSEHTARARLVAESGLQQYIGTVTSRPPEGDSVRINVPGGYTDVVARIVQRPADTLDPQTYVVRATGYHLEPSVSSTPIASATVARYAAWQVGTMLTRAGLTAANGVRRRNGAGPTVFWGPDLCGAESPVPGVRTTIIAGPGAGAGEAATGTPAGYVEEGGNQGQPIAVQTEIQWLATIGGGLVPDHTSIQKFSSAWSIQRVQGDAELRNGFGTGLLIVSGDLEFRGSWAMWFGVILVGGRVDFNSGYNYVRGAIVSGLNEQLGQNPQQTLFGGNGRQLYVYNDSCFKRQALASLTGFAEVPNARVGTWDTY